MNGIEADLISEEKHTSRLELQRLPLVEHCSRNIGCNKNLFSGDQSRMSPITNLAHNMTHILGLNSGSLCDTPKGKTCGDKSKFVKRLSECSLSSSCSDAGVYLDFPSPLDIDVEETFKRAILESGKVIKDRHPIRRINSLPVTLGCSPALKTIGHEDSDVFHSPCTEKFGQDENKENEGFEFKKPSRPVARCRSRTFQCGKDAFAERPNSAPALMLSSPEKDGHELEDSPVLLRKCSLTCSVNDDEDDGFMDILDEDYAEPEAGIPSGMASLLTAPLVKKQDEDNIDAASIIKTRPRGLFRSPSMPNSGIRPPLKRVERPADEDTPVKIKRRKSICVTQETQEQKPRVVRSRSFCHTEIDRVLDCENRSPDFIGDFSKTYALPTVKGKHDGLKYITPEMMAAVLNGKYNSLIDHCGIIDCRYPYEFEGGHIKGALNLHLEEEAENCLLKQPIISSEAGKRVILVFHCEFSSERGPRMCKFVREQDRKNNEYPNLHYPELYILLGGYKDFFQRFKMHCEPQGYRPMHHEDFKEDLKKFRLKSRTWAGEKSKRDLYSRLKNL
ncbi:M-phase inducer phosphatase 2 isoform X2 [Protopterus annectens]|uniref:M-phase inducer phosphatase 2 isoform X2 n=1 Tax=Protopterus annectens TaxID=7888 RepID=UPI001CF9DB47|nr:M-phase inducer phosphatase 2 isoform X2 [Protopterus annectens]